MKIASFAQVKAHPEARVFSCLLLLIGAAVEIARIVRDTFFITNAGAEFIPWAYMIFASVMIISSFCYAKASKRYNLGKLAAATIALAMVSILVEYWLIATGHRERWLAFALFASVEMSFLFVPMTLWAFANQIFSVEDGERFLPRIASAGLIGTVAGGLIARLIVKEIGVYSLLLLCSGALFGALLLALKRLDLSISPRCAFQADAPVLTEEERLRSAEFFGGALSESLVKTLVFIAAPMWVLVYTIEYTYYHTMGVVFESETELAAFLSVFVAFSSCVALIVQFWVTPWLTHKFGVAKTSALYPAALALSGVLTLVFSLTPTESLPKNELSVAVSLVLIARLLDISLFQSVYESTVHVLYYAVPQSIRTQARALVAGIVFPLSIACAGLLLVFFTTHAEPVHNIAFCSVAIGFLVVVMALDIPLDYLSSLLEHTDDNEQRRAELLREISALGINEARYVISGALRTKNTATVRQAVESLSSYFPPQFISELLAGDDPDALDEPISSEITQ